MKFRYLYVLLLVVALVLCGCGKSAELPQTAVLTAAPTQETTGESTPTVRDPNNGDGTFTIGLDDVFVTIDVPEGMECKGYNKEQVTVGRDDGSDYIWYSVTAVPGDLETAGAALMERIDSSCDRAKENGIPFQRQDEQVTVGGLKFDCGILVLEPEGREAKTYMFAWAPIAQAGDMSYYIELRNVSAVADAEAQHFTMDDVRTYLNAVTTEN